MPISRREMGAGAVAASLGTAAVALNDPLTVLAQEAFRAKFRLAELAVEVGSLWTWSVRPGQVTLGAGILSLNRPCAALGDITPAEGSAFAEAVQRAERRLREVFAYDKINHLLLMMVDRHLHLHIIPRYAQDKEAFGVRWTDPGWPGPPQLGHENPVADTSLIGIRDLLVGSGPV